MFCIRARLYGLWKNSCFVSRHDFSRAVTGLNRDGLYRAAEKLAVVPAPDFSPGSGFSNPRERFGISIEGFSPGGASSEQKPI